MKFVLIILSTLLAVECMASEINLLIPAYTMHTKYPSEEVSNDTGIIINDKVYGLGIEYKTESNYIFGIGNLNKNSEGNKSIFAYSGYVSSITKNIKVGVALGIGTGYTLLAENSRLIYPAFSFKYKMLRVVTSYPFGQILYKGADFNTDFISIQIVIPVK